MKLYELKVGDEVICRGGGPLSKPTVMEITRLTKTMIICGQNRRFNRKTGRTSGGHSLFSSYLVPGTEKELAEIKNQQRKRNIVASLSYDVDWDKLELSSLIKIYSLVCEEIDQ